MTGEMNGLSGEAFLIGGHNRYSFGKEFKRGKRNLMKLTMAFDGMMEIVAIMSLGMGAINPAHINNVQFVGFPTMNPEERVMFLKRRLKNLSKIVERVVDSDVVSNTDNSKFCTREWLIFEVSKEKFIIVSRGRNTRG